MKIDPTRFSKPEEQKDEDLADLNAETIGKKVGSGIKRDMASIFGGLKQEPLFEKKLDPE